MPDELIDLVSHAATTKLIASILDDADEATIKTAMSEFPAIIAQMLAEVVRLIGKDAAAGR
jgi:hypothetical protein